MNKIDHSVNQRFTSRLGLLLSALGIAIGTGNIWRFPRIVALNGGEDGAGAFLVSWVVFLFLWSIPLIIGEYVLGRKFRKGVVGTLKRAIGKRFTWMGAFVAFVTLGITFFYTVVIGWCMYYFFRSLFSPLPLNTQQAMNVWSDFQNSGWPFVFHALVVIMGGILVWRGINSIERTNKFLIPAMLLIVLISVVRALTLPGAMEGVRYLFTPDWQDLLKPSVWLDALSQNAWDTGAGWGLFITYAAYMKKEHGTVKNAFMTAIGNNTVSILAALMIFGTVFGVLRTEMGLTRPEVIDVMQTSGPASTGLTFIWMPQLFSKMFMGPVLSVLFFLGLTFAATSTLMALLEMCIRILIDTGIKRPKAILITVIFTYLMGIPAALSVGFLSNQDHVWGIALMISGAFIAFAIIKNNLHIIRAELNADKDDWRIGRWWIWIIKYFVPVAAVILLIWWLMLSATVYAKDEWYNPFHSYSVMTCIVQWGMLFVILIMLNKYLMRITK